ncbi:hypothetical protein TNCV_1543401 [Trichonephila clavipes]|nr:hypothetical protein TNCV_1543401 [Trichonephila clavipes]
MENVRRRVDIRLCSTEEQARKLIAKSNFNRRTIFSENLMAVHLKKTQIKFFKPIQEKTTQLVSRNETTQLCTAVDRLQPPATACNRLQPPATAYNRLQPPATACNRLQPPTPPTTACTACTAFTAESAFSTYLRANVMRTNANILPCRTVPAVENFLWNEIEEKISL